ncbi:PAS domain-containing protein [Paracoccus sediminicola]|uniref:PAS domain-containing protein n=1 Tax=Paracoccus sediminicola TaxID=3017783 RepID=UPI0022F0EBA6|nr:PAS domain-containing protein [Paracoccus sediminicola]WBU57795.1 PAS domain-containing protein [Paracoccus sediminicola]
MGDERDDKRKGVDRIGAEHTGDKIAGAAADGVSGGGSVGKGTGGNCEIVSISAVAPDPGRITAEMRAYWESLRRGRAIPERADVEPNGIRQALDYAFILERIAPGAARFRLAGRHLVDLMGMEVRGMPVCALLNTESRGRFSDVLETVFRGPQIAEMVLRAPPGYGRPELCGKILVLPLKSDLGDITRALGCLVTKGEIGRGPRRFDVAAETLFPVIDGAQTLPPRSGKPTGTPAAGPGPNLPRPVLQPLSDKDSPEDRRARFRVIATEDRR